MKDGGPAFPNDSMYTNQTENGEFISVKDGGMSLLDYFAAAALTGLMAFKDAQDNPSKAAVWAYDMGAAMLGEREAHR